MSIVTDGQRSEKWRSFAKQKLQMLKDLGLSAKSYVVDGYMIALSTMDDIDKARVTAPPGAVVVDFTDGKYEYRYADQYGGDFTLFVSRLPADGIVPSNLFSGVGELMYHAASAYSEPESLRYVMSASWYAPRPNLPASPTAEGSGYLAGRFSMSSVDPAGTKMAGHALTRNACFYASSHVHVWPGSSYAERVPFASFGVGISRGGVGFSADFSPQGTYPEFLGRGSFLRPVWGSDAVLLYVVHANAAASPSSGLGTASVMALLQAVSTEPFQSAGTYGPYLVDQDAIIPTIHTSPHYDGTYPSVALALGAHLDPYYPYPLLPHFRRAFSCDDLAVCFWQPLQPFSEFGYGWNANGIVFSTDGTAENRWVKVPVHDTAIEQPIITEVSAGWYSCIVEVVADGAAKGDITAVYYGMPFVAGVADGGVWTALALPAGTVLKHKTIKATADSTVALALVYAPDSDETWLYEYDSSRSPEWSARGMVGAGKLSEADVAVFGNHPVAIAAALDSPVSALLPAQ